MNDKIYLKILEIIGNKKENLSKFNIDNGIIRNEEGMYTALIDIDIQNLYINRLFDEIYHEIVVFLEEDLKDE